MKLIFSMLLVLLFAATPSWVNAQEGPLQVLPANGQAGNTLVFYIGGDGGWNSFSQELCNGWVKKGYPVVVLDSRKYFWVKKTPEQAATDLGAWIKNYQASLHCNSVILVGYSFGADVLPFMFNRLDVSQKTNVRYIGLISPSGATDLEVKISGMLGMGAGKLDVRKEVSLVNTTPVKIILSEEGKGAQPYTAGGKLIKPIIIPGGHHYKGHIALLSKYMIAP
jgi:type IV secretory pathway VirJ component